MQTSASLLVSTLVAAILAGTDPLSGDPLWPQSGSYEVTFRLELPHLERWAIDVTKTLCLSRPMAGSGVPFPVLSPNTPFANCSPAHLAIDHGTMDYDIVCPGRGAARAHASYTVGPNGVAGRVAMVMGAKNMTMTEVQHLRRVGDCNSASLNWPSTRR